MVLALKFIRRPILCPDSFKYVSNCAWLKGRLPFVPGFRRARPTRRGQGRR